MTARASPAPLLRAYSIQRRREGRGAGGGAPPPPPWSADRRPPCADPATWMLDISTIAAESRLGADLAAVYASSQLARCCLGTGAEGTETLKNLKTPTMLSFSQADRLGPRSMTFVNDESGRSCINFIWGANCHARPATTARRKRMCALGWKTGRSRLFVLSGCCPNHTCASKPYASQP